MIWLETMGATGNLLFAGKKAGQEEEGFFAHALCSHVTEKMATPLSSILCVSSDLVHFELQIRT